VYSDDEVAALYDAANPWDAGDACYLSYVMAAESVLDVGCGTGRLLHRARTTGHTGRLCGVDPDVAALNRARTRRDVEWVEGTAEEMKFPAEFALAVMAGNAFQVLITDDELRRSLAAIRAALRDDGRFVFGTRNPLVRAWESWHPGNASDVTDRTGRELRLIHHVESVVDGVVTMTETIATRDGTVLRVDRGRLRFLDTAALDRLLDAAGFTVESRHGDWSGGPWTPASVNIITVARATSSPATTA
jgi:SAM-dependent methyltransferase